MDAQKLKQLLSEEESIYLEFKQELDLVSNSSKAKFAREVLSLANSSIPVGYLIAGIEDKTKRILVISVTVVQSVQES